MIPAPSSSTFRREK